LILQQNLKLSYFPSGPIDVTPLSNGKKHKKLIKILNTKLNILITTNPKATHK
jgi:hypothetical protein